MAETNLKSVSTTPKAFCAMALHACSHKNETVHGVLLGKSAQGSVDVQEAVPVSHGTPTKPLIEIALGLIESKTELSIVGWYTSPVLLGDKRAGPVALRMASTLAVGTVEPTLIVVQNTGLGEVLKGDTKDASKAIQAFGKDFGGQYLEPVSTKVTNSENACGSLRKIKEGPATISDLVDHFENSASDAWFDSPILAGIS